MKKTTNNQTSSAPWSFKPLRQFRVVFFISSTLIPVVGAETAPVYKNADAPVDARVSDLLGRMTTEEKVSQLQCEMAPLLEKEGKQRDYNVGFIRAVGIRPKPSDCARVNNEDTRKSIENSRLGIPVLNHEETLHAGGSTIASTLVPISLAIAATWDEDLAYRAYRAISDEARAVNIRQHYSPTLYFTRDPRWGRTEETYGEDPFMVTRFGLAFIKAIRDADAVPTIKGYPYNYGDGGRDSYPTYISERQYRSLWFIPWEAAVRQYGDVMSVMPAYSTINDYPVHADSWLLTKILREEWGFKGMVTSDYGDHGMGLVYRTGIAKTPPEGAAMVLASGCDSVHPNGAKALPEAVKLGLVTPAILDQAVARVLRVKFLSGLFDRPYVDAGKADLIVRSAEHQQIALESAQKSIVLLKNSNNILPLKKSGKIGVFGPAAATFFGGGYGRANIPSDISPLKGLQQRLGDNVQFLVHDNKSVPSILAQQADVNLVFVTMVEGEAFDRSSLDLPVFKGDKKPKAAQDDLTIIVNENNREFTEGDQEALIRAVAKGGKPTVVVLVTGAPVTMQHWIADASAVVQMWYAGEKGGLAIADVLFGDINPGARLPITFPKVIGQVPIYYNAQPVGRSDKYWDDDGKPAFPFGFGLSYTTFEMSNLKVVSDATSEGTGSVKVSVEVKNTGSRSGDEVVQVYLRDNLASVVRPLKELKAFQRVSLKPGEIKSVSLSIPAKELEILNRNMKRVIEPGSFNVLVGSNAENLPLKVAFSVR